MCFENCEMLLSKFLEMFVFVCLIVSNLCIVNLELGLNILKYLRDIVNWLVLFNVDGIWYLYKYLL